MTDATVSEVKRPSIDDALKEQEAHTAVLVGLTRLHADTQRRAFRNGIAMLALALIVMVLGCIDIRLDMRQRSEIATLKAQLQACTNARTYGGLR